MSLPDRSCTEPDCGQPLIGGTCPVHGVVGSSAKYFIRYIPGIERPYRVYYLNRAGKLKRTRGVGHNDVEGAVEHVERLKVMDAERTAAGV